MSLFAISYTILGVMELFHIMAHCNVLFPISRVPLRASFFYSHGWYFVLDTMTVFFNLLFITRLFSWYSPVLLVIIASQMIQHFYFALSWSPEVERVKSIVEWSVQEPEERKLRSDHWVKFIGTSFDVLTHAICFVLDIYSIFEVTQHTALTFLCTCAMILLSSFAFIWYIGFFQKIKQRLTF